MSLPLQDLPYSGSLPLWDGDCVGDDSGRTKIVSSGSVWIE